jgi:hypothetical protein
MLPTSIMAGVAIMVGVTIMAEAAIIGAVTGVEVYGLARDGVGADGVRGGVRRTIPTIRTMHHPLLSSNKSLLYMLSRPLNKRSKATGIIAGIPRDTIHM